MHIIHYTILTFCTLYITTITAIELKVQYSKLHFSKVIRRGGKK